MYEQFAELSFSSNQFSILMCFFFSSFILFYSFSVRPVLTSKFQFFFSFLSFLWNHQTIVECVQSAPKSKLKFHLSKFAAVCNSLLNCWFSFFFFIIFYAFLLCSALFDEIFHVFHLQQTKMWLCGINCRYLHWTTENEWENECRECIERRMETKLKIIKNGIENVNGNVFYWKCFCMFLMILNNCTTVKK